MPRIGITESQMLAAITALQNRKEPITKITVRKELGDTGSFGTISSFLARWRENQRATEVVASATPIPEMVQNQFSLVWSTARAEAKAEFTRERDAMTADMSEVRKELANARSENDEALRILESQLEGRFAELAELTSKEQMAQLRITELAERIGYLSARMEDAQKAQVDAESLYAGVKFWIWSSRKQAWWEVGRCGYTKLRDQAGVYTLADLRGASIEDLDADDVPSLRDVLVVKEGLIPIEFAEE